jgi:hypothetical protein
MPKKQSASALTTEPVPHQQVRERALELVVELRQKTEIKTTGLFGAGTMGGGIAWLFSYRDVPVRVRSSFLTQVRRNFPSKCHTP